MKKDFVYVPVCDDLGAFPYAAYKDMFSLAEHLEFISNYKKEYKRILSDNNLNIWHKERLLDELEKEKELIGYEMEFLQEFFNTSFNDVVNDSNTFSIQIVIRTNPIKDDDFPF